MSETTPKYEGPELIVLHRTQYGYVRRGNDLPAELPRPHEIYSPYTRTDIANANTRKAVREALEKVKIRIEERCNYSESDSVDMLYDMVNQLISQYKELPTEASDEE